MYTSLCVFMYMRAQKRDTVSACEFQINIHTKKKEKKFGVSEWNEYIFTHINSVLIIAQSYVIRKH